MTGTGADLEISWITAVSDLAAIAEEWRALATRTQSEIYLSPDWVGLWWKHFDRGRKLVCFLARRDGDLVGVLPFCIETLWAGPIPVRVARLAGTDPHCMVFRLPVEEAVARPLMAAALGQLIGARRCVGVSFTPVSELSDLVRLVPGAMSDGMILTERAEGNHVVFDTTDGYESFFAGLTKKRRSQYRRDVKALEDLYGMTHRLCIPNNAEFGDFVDFHNRQWQAVGKGGHFRDWPGSAAFYVALSERTRAAGQVQLHGEAGRDGMLADQFVLVAGGTAHWRLPARTLDPEAEKLSVGKVGLLRMLEALTAAGVRRIEAGRGEYDYKLAYGGNSVPVRRFIVGARSGALRLRMLLAWADLLHLVYYRAWFLKFAPRVRRITGGQSRPLWRSWIRTRV